jgi:mono/diheme cytochrome c family protein
MNARRLAFVRFAIRFGLWLGLAVACTREPAPPPAIELATWPAGDDEAFLAREAKRFIDDTAYRRVALEASLANHDNIYSHQRLQSYALGSRGWDSLPVWNPRSVPLTVSAFDAAPKRATDTPLWDGRVPATRAEWIALGRRVFFEYPLRAEVFMEYALERPALAAEVGVERAPDGSLPGLVVFANVDGAERVGITCAICHTSVRDGELVVGAARRSFDYGKLRLAYFRDTNTAVEPELARRMATWGPGRADVTEDNDEDPVAIPDLWGLRSQSALTQAGTITHASPLALAIRQDTQLIHTNHQRIRPPRELAWALAMFIYSLEPPARTLADPVGALRGAPLFAVHCSGCHENAAFGGKPIPDAKIGTDTSLARGQARGTGRYRVPPLVDVSRGAPYLHHGVVPSLDELLSPARTIPGHRAGTDLSDDDRAALIAFLEML